MIIQIPEVLKERFWNVLLLMLSSSFVLSGQTSYYAIVLDQSTNLPVTNVNVLIVNSTEGYYSDVNGRFSISNEIAAGSDLIFSHVNYEANSKHIPIDYSGKDTIYLTPTSHHLEDVTITSKKNDLKKKRLLLFKQDLFDFLEGKKNMHKEVDLLNPEDLLFQISDSLLLAKSNQILEFKNKYLGYEMKCYMEEYRRGDSTLLFSGKASFKDLSVSKRKRKKFQKRREELWEESQQYFLRSVLENRVWENKFMCSALIPTQIEDGYQIIRDFKDFVYPTKFENIYAIITPGPISIKTKKHLSHIIPEKGIVLINKSGNILNKEEVKLRGYWEEMSLTKFLPSDYKKVEDKILLGDSKTKRTIGELKLWAKELQSFAGSKRTMDEIIIETDRLIYEPFERVLVSTRVFDHMQRSAVDDCLVKIELVNQDNEVLVSKTKLAKKGVCQTSFLLPDTLPSTQYGIRAYTGLMRNFSENLFGKTTIGITLAESRYYPIEEDTVFLTFAPEGGKLLFGLENRVVVYTNDNSGRPIDFQGTVIDNELGKELLLQTIVPGLAVLNLVPSPSSTYEIKSKFSVVSNISELVPTAGTNLQVFTRNKDHFKVTIASNKEDAPSSIQIVDRGRIVDEIETTNNLNNFSVSKDFLPNEILSLQLVDDEQQVLSERLIDNTVAIKPLLEFKKQYQFFYQSQNGEIEIVQDSLSEDFVDSLVWNVRVVHNSFDQGVPNTCHLSKLPLRSEAFDNLSLANKSYIRNLELIGNEVLSEYKTAYQMEISDYKYTEDFSLSFSGWLKHPDPPHDHQAGWVSITSLSPVPFTDETPTDDSGYFKFENLPYEANLEFIIQARKNVSEGDNLLDGDRYVDIKIAEDTMSSKISKTAFHFRQDLIPNDSIIDYRRQMKDKLSQMIELDEVVIKDRVNAAVRTGLVKDVEKMDWVPKQARGQELLRHLYPGKVVRRSIQDPGQLEILINMPRQGFVYQTMSIFINGTEEFGSALFESLEADRIKYLSLNQSTLSIVTTPGAKSRTASREDELGIMIHAIQETLDDTDLSSINFTADMPITNSGKRKTLYWNPEIMLTKSSTEKISFISSMLTGTYQVIASTIHPRLGYISFSDTFEVVEK